MCIVHDTSRAIEKIVYTPKELLAKELYRRHALALSSIFYITTLYCILYV